MSIVLTVNGEAVRAAAGTTLLAAAERAGIYIPRLCHHPALGSSHGLRPAEAVHRAGGCYRHDGSRDEFPGCRLCLVEVEGYDALRTACDTPVAEGMVVRTETAAVKQQRRDRLVEVLRDHPHACLLCAQREGCSRTQCSANVPAAERCCELLGRCELQKVADYVGIRSDIPRYVPRGLPVHDDEPLFVRDYNLCIACLRCVRACNDLRGVATLGYVFHDRQAVVGTTGDATLAGSGCRFCGACVAVCPTGALTDRALPPGEREAALVPCVAGCPAGLDIPRYISHVRRGEPAEALAVIRERLPLPTILGMACFRPCEATCRRGQLNEPMAICALKRYAADHDDRRWLQRVQLKAPTGRRVAVVGGGPAGLAAAYFVRLAGHAVTVFEAEARPGGMLRYAIPDYRLPPAVVEREVQLLAELGIRFQYHTRVGGDITLAQLRRDYDAVFLGTGATLSRKIPLAGSKTAGVHWGVDFLRRVKIGRRETLAGRVLVIGGGNVAIDVARTAVRLGADRVELACLETKAEMPAHAWEIAEAREEGVRVHPAWGPQRILGQERVTGLELVRCTSVFDERGRFAPSFDDSVTKTIATDNVILAVGQAADLAYAGELGLALAGGTLAVEADSGRTSAAGVFAGGEAVRGPSSIIEAVADGARAAAAIDEYLGGTGDIYIPLVEAEGPEPRLAEARDFASLARITIPTSAPEKRKQSFALIERTYSAGQATAEALRCLRCDLRLAIAPVTLPPERWLPLTAEQVARVPAAGGVFQLLDQAREIIVIKGTPDLRADLEAKLGADTAARYFGCEPDPMYSQRESELIQQYLQQHGRMPPGDGDDDNDDLF